MSAASVVISSTSKRFLAVVVHRGQQHRRFVFFADAGRRRLLTSSPTTAPAPSLFSSSAPPPPPPSSSIDAIPVRGMNIPKSAGAVIRQVGCTRRVFLRQPYLTQPELEGLAHRIHKLSKNRSINSILIATNDDDDDDGNCLPTCARDAERPYVDVVDIGHHGPKSDRYVWHVASGYDPLEVYRRRRQQQQRRGGGGGGGESVNDDKESSLLFIPKLLHSLQQLALAVKGDAVRTHVPVVTVPHGLVTDGGYALCMGSHVMATPDTSFRITNPSRGLSFDPVGLSYLLPRLGSSFLDDDTNNNNNNTMPSSSDATKHHHHHHPAAGMLLALTGMEANAEDMLELGLATHYMDSVSSTLGTLERTLSELLPWELQTVKRRPTRLHGQSPFRAVVMDNDDLNAPYRNVSVAHTLHAFCTYHVSGRDVWSINSKDDTWMHAGDDPSIDLDVVPWHAERESWLVDVAATFQPLFHRQKSLTGLLSKFQDVANGKTDMLLAQKKNPQKDHGDKLRSPLSKAAQQQDNGSYNDNHVGVPVEDNNNNSDNDDDDDEVRRVAADIVERIQRQSPLALRVVHRLLQLGRRDGETLESCMEREKRVQAKMFAQEDFERWAGHASQYVNDSSSSSGGGEIPPFRDWKHKSVKHVTREEVDEIVVG